MDQEPSGLTARDYEHALLSQNACNLSGIVHSFHEVVTRVWEDACKLGKGTDWVNHHPICVLYAEQIAFLSGGGGTANMEYNRSRIDCERGAWNEPLYYYKDVGELTNGETVQVHRDGCGGTTCCGGHCGASDDRVPDHGGCADQTGHS